MSGTPVVLNLATNRGSASSSRGSRKPVSRATGVDTNLFLNNYTKSGPDRIDDLNNLPYVDDETPKRVPIQQPGRPFDERADNNAVNGRNVAEESIRRYLLRFQNPLIQHLCNVSASANINSYLDLTDKQESLTSELPIISSGEVGEFDLDFESGDLVTNTNKEILEKITSALFNREGNQSQNAQQILNIITRNRALDIRYSGSFENLGILRFSAKFVKCNESALVELKEYFQTQGKDYDHLKLSDLILSNDTGIKTSFADLCAYFLVLSKAENLSRPVSDIDMRNIAKKREKALNYFSEVIFDSGVLRVERNSRKKRKLKSIDDLYEECL